MTIQAQRFKFLDQQTNVPTADLLTQKDSGILNQAFGQIDSTLSGIGDSINAGKQSITDPLLAGLSSLTSGSSPTNELSRSLKTAFSTAVVPNSDLTNLEDNLFGTDTGLKSLFRTLSTDCKNSILGILGNCHAAQSFNLFNGRSRNTSAGACSVSGFAALLSKLTGGLFNPQTFDPCREIQLLTGLSIHGNRMGLGGTFPSLISTTSDTYVKNQVGAYVFTDATKRNDFYSMYDVATSPVGPDLKNVIPGVSQMALNSFQIPSEVKERNLEALSTDFDATMTNLDPSWNVYSDNGVTMPSLANLSKPNADLSTLYQAKVKAVSVDYAGFVASPSSYVPTYANNEDALFANMDNVGQNTAGAISSAFPNIAMDSLGGTSESAFSSFI